MLLGTDVEIVSQYSSWGKLHLVHNDVVDGVLICVLVVAEVHGVPLWIVPHEVLRSTQSQLARHAAA